MKNSVLFGRRDLQGSQGITQMNRFLDLPPFLHPSLPPSSLPLPFSVSFPHPTAFGVEEKLHSDLGENVNGAMLILPGCLKKQRLEANRSSVRPTSLARHILPSPARIAQVTAAPSDSARGLWHLAGLFPSFLCHCLRKEAQERGTEEKESRKPTSTGAPSLSILQWLPSIPVLPHLPSSSTARRCAWDFSQAFFRTQLSHI